MKYNESTKGGYANRRKTMRMKIKNGKNNYQKKERKDQKKKETFMISRTVLWR